MVKRPLVLTAPPTEETATEQATIANGLLEELHSAQMFSRSGAAERHLDVQEWAAEVSRAYDDWIGSGHGMVEPIFYGDDGAYDFQYIEMAKKEV